MSDSKAVRRRSRGGGGAARRAERTSVNFETAKYIERNIPLFNVLNDEALEIIETNACLLYTSPSPRDMRRSRMPSSA